MFECIIKNFAFYHILIPILLIVFWYTLGWCVMRKEIEMIKNESDPEFPYDNLSKLSVFKMITFWPLEKIFGEQRVKNRKG